MFAGWESHPRIIEAERKQAAERASRLGALGDGPALAARLAVELPSKGQKPASVPESSVDFVLTAEGIPFEREHRFHPVRRWRIDRVVLPLSLKVGIEVQGGYHGGKGRHSRGEGFERDCEKFTEAAIAGWLIVLVPSGKVADRLWVGQVRRAMEMRAVA